MLPEVEVEVAEVEGAAVSHKNTATSVSATTAGLDINSDISLFMIVFVDMHPP